MKRLNKEALYGLGVTLVFIVILLAIGTGLFYGAGTLGTVHVFGEGWHLVREVAVGFLVGLGFSAWVAAIYVVWATVFS